MKSYGINLIKRMLCDVLQDIVMKIWNVNKKVCEEIHPQFKNLNDTMYFFNILEECNFFPISI